jgi:hypothetical protein
MKNRLLFIALTAISGIGIQAQSINSLLIEDTRNINDLPNFSFRSIRADFKERSVIGAPGSGYYSTNLTISPWTNIENSGGKNHQLSFNDGGVFYRVANPMDSQWGNWRQVLITDDNGNVGIGTANPRSRLTVAGNISAREVQVTVDAGADFVFEEDYNLKSLDSVEKYIKENKHLPEIASAQEMKKEGINLSEMNIKLLQKVEELTLYMIEMKKDITILKEENKALKEKNKQ